MFHNLNQALNPRQLFSQRKCLIRTLFILILGILGFILTLKIPLSDRSSYIFRHGFSPWLVAAIFILYVALKFPANHGKSLTLCLILILFALPLTALFQQGYGEMQIIGGLLSFSDSARYYQEASRLLYGFPFTGFGARHPFFPAFLSAILWMMRNNLQLALSSLVILNAIGVYLASRYLESTHSPVVASLFIIFTFLFYRRFIGMTDTENLGLFIGLLAFSFLWHGANTQNLAMIISGLFFSSFALNTRPGAFFILPTLLFWFITSILSDIKQYKRRYFGLAAFVIVFPFIINIAMTQFMSDRSERLFSNYAYTLYGISDGGSGWEQIYQDHPEILKLSEYQAARFAYQQAINNIQTNPKAIIQSIIMSYKDFFSLKHQSAFGFISGGDLTAFNNVKPENFIIYKSVRAIIWFLFLLGVIWLIKERRHKLHSLLLWGLFGVILSIPFLPPRDAAIMRVYAASISFIIIIPLMGLNWVLLLFPSSKCELNKNYLKPYLTSSLGILLLIFVIIIPVVLRILINPSSFQPINCQSGSKSAVIVIHKNAYIFVREDTSIENTRLPEIRQSDFIQSLGKMPYGDTLQELTHLEPPVVIMNALDLQNGQLLWVIMPSDSLKSISIPLGVCGIWLPDSLSKGLGFLYVNRFYIIN
jgi:hypothetical protein